MERSVTGLRYDALIKQAEGSRPLRPGSKERPEIMVEGSSFNHLTLSRGRVSRPGVEELRHFVLYRRRGDVVEVARSLHDTCNLERHLPE